KHPPGTATAFGTEGWCRSGVLGRLDANGCLRVTGRLKDIIIRGGFNISAREVEDNLLTHPNVKDVAVVSMPDAVLGERACAFVVPTGEVPTLNDLVTYLRVERRVSPTQLHQRRE